MTGAADLARRLDLVRVATFGYAAAWLALRSRYVWDVSGLPSRQFEPVGVLAWLDWLPSRPAVVSVAVITFVAAVSAAAGRALPLTAPVAALGMLLIATLTSSFGQVFHTEHLLVLHLLVLAGYALGGTRRALDGGWAVRWALVMLCAVTAVTYVVAGAAKLRLSGPEWVTGDVLRNWVAADNLRKELLDDPSSAIGGYLAGVAWVWPPIAAATLAVELGAPFALLARRARLAWVLAAWSFHVGVLALMAISFPYQLSGVAYLAALPLERVEAHLRGPSARVVRTLARRGKAAREVSRPDGAVRLGMVGARRERHHHAAAGHPAVPVDAPL